MGKGKGGGGGNKNDAQVNIPAGLYNTIASTSGLGQYGTALLDSLGSMTNWAASLASGGTAGQVPTVGSVASQPGPGILFHAKGTEWASSFNPQTGLITFTNPHAPQQTFVSTLEQAKNEGADIPQGVLDQWNKGRSEFLQNQGTAGSMQHMGGDLGGFVPIQGWQGYTQDGAQVPTYFNPQTQQIWTATGGVESLSKFGPNAVSQMTAQYNQQYPQGVSGSPFAGGPAMGPFLGTAWSEIQQQEKLPSQMQGIEAQTAALNTEATGEGQWLMGQGQQELTQATTGSGLFPSQEAFVNQARQQGETESAAMLSKLGLSESTMSPALKEQADLSAAATAGQLVQGNITAAQRTLELGQASQKIALGAQALETDETKALADMYASIATQSLQFQKTLWDEALSGYGVLGQLVSTAGQSYGYSLQGYKSIIDAEAATAQNQTAMDEAKMKSDSSGTSSLLSTVGSIIGAVVSIL